MIHRQGVRKTKNLESKQACGYCKFWLCTNLQHEQLIPVLVFLNILLPAAAPTALVATANSDFAQTCSMSSLFQSWFFLIFYFLLLLQLHLWLWVWKPTPALVNHMNSTRSSHIQDALRDRWSTRKKSGKDLTGNFLALSEVRKDNMGDWGPLPNDELWLEPKHIFVAINLFSCSL